MSHESTWEAMRSDNMDTIRHDSPHIRNIGKDGNNGISRKYKNKYAERRGRSSDFICMFR